MGSYGTTLGCITESENTIRILATGVEYTPPQEDPVQTSLSLDPAVISLGFKGDGRGDNVEPGQGLFLSLPSLLNIEYTLIAQLQYRAEARVITGSTSVRPRISRSLTVSRSQVRARVPSIAFRLIPCLNFIGGSCNNAPMGVIPSVDNMPSAKFISPQNFATFPRNQNITVQIAISHLETGWFTNPLKTYMTSPQDVNMSGDVLGHSHVTVDALTGFNQTTPTDPRNPAFFQGLNSPAVNGVLSVVIGGGLPAGYYRIAVSHAGANHQPSASNRNNLPDQRRASLIAALKCVVALPVARRGATDDMVYVSIRRSVDPTIRQSDLIPL